MRKIDIYTTKMAFARNKKPEEVLQKLIDAVGKDMETYFWVSIENFSSFDQVGSVFEWVYSYKDCLISHLSTSVKIFLDDNGYSIDDLLVNAPSIFSRLIEEAREYFSEE